MSKLVKLDEFRIRQAAARGFAPWQKRFGDSFLPGTCFSNLREDTIETLAEPGEESASIFYELILGVLDLGNILRFEYVKPAERLIVVDTHLFLADLVRYEMMHRIQWIDGYPDQEIPIIRLILEFDASDYSRYNNPPQLMKSHPQYEEFNSRIRREKMVMLRQLFPEALAVFRAHLDNH